MDNNTSDNLYNQYENAAISSNTSESFNNYSDIPTTSNIANSNYSPSGNNSTTSTFKNFFSNASLEPSTMKHRIGQLTNKLKEIKDNNFSDTRNWYQFIGPERGKYQLPSAMSDASTRVRENVVYFQTNYLIFFLLFAAYFVITEPVFLFLLVLIFLISVYIHYINPSITDTQKKIAYALQIFLSVYFILSAGHTIFWLLGASLTIILLHSSLHVPTAQELKNGVDIQGNNSV